MKNGIVERFEPTIEHEPYGLDYAEMREVKNGEFVRYKDYLHERETVKKLKRLLAKKKRREMRKGKSAKENAINYRETW